MMESAPIIGTQWRNMAFSLPAIPMAAMNLSLAVFLPQYYATETMIGLAAIGFAFMVVRLGDLTFDLFLGVAVDRTLTPIGRFRPWMLAGVPVTIFGCWLAYFPPADATLAYLIVALVSVFAGYSMVLITQFSWAAVLAENPVERSRILGWIQAASVFGMLLILALIPIINSYAPDMKDVAVRGMGVFIMLVTPLTVLLMIAVSKEPSRAKVHNTPSLRQSLSEYGRVLIRPNITRVMATTMLLALASGVTSALFLFFAATKGFTPAQSTSLLIIYFIGAFVSAHFWAPISKRVAKSKMLAFVCGFSMLVGLLALFLPFGAFVLAGMGQLALGSAFSGKMVLLKSIVGDEAEFAKGELSEDFTARLYAIYLTITKASMAIAVGLIFFILQIFGYDPKLGLENTADKLFYLQLCFILIPAALVFCGGLVIFQSDRRLGDDSLIPDELEKVSV